MESFCLMFFAPDDTPAGISEEISRGELVAAETDDNEVETAEEAGAQNVAPPIFAPVINAREELQAEFEEVFGEWKRTGDPKLRERLILRHKNLVVYLARRFVERGELFEDIVQIGLVGLINALDAFDPERGVKFSTFATPTIAGEIRRYFRDKVGGLRVPRRLQELHISLPKIIEELTSRLDRSPTYREIAAAMSIEVEEVVELLELNHVLDPISLDNAHTNSDDPNAATLADTLGAPDPAIQSFEDHAALQSALARLTDKERKVLEMAYFQGCSQVDIARRLNVSQMHISRLLRRALSQLRQLLEEG